MNLELARRTRLETADGEDLGTMKEFVIDPGRTELTHVIVEKGIFFPDDRVVPVDTIDQVQDDRAILSPEVDPDGLPRFVIEDYSPADAATRARLPDSQEADYMWRYPTTYGGPFPVYPVYPIPATASRREADDAATRDRLAGSEVIDSDTPVLSMDGEKVGKVAEMQIDAEGLLSHLVIDLGFLSGEKVLPAHWIDSIESDGVPRGGRQRAGNVGDDNVISPVAAPWLAASPGREALTDD